MDEKIPSVLATDNESGVKYELDFSRDSVRFAENRGFELENVAKFPVTGISDLFYYSFRMHHPKMARANTDKLLESWGGLSERLLERLIQLYQQAQTANTIQTNEDEEKNAAVTLEM